MLTEAERPFDQESLEDRKLAQIVESLVKVYGPQAVYLFGSAARGAAGPDSDYDLLLVVSDSAPEQLRRARVGYQALWKLGTGADIAICTRTEFESRLHLKASLPATVLREGKLLYAA